MKLLCKVLAAITAAYCVHAVALPAQSAVSLQQKIMQALSISDPMEQVRTLGDLRFEANAEGQLAAYHAALKAAQAAMRTVVSAPTPVLSGPVSASVILTAAPVLGHSVSPVPARGRKRESAPDGLIDLVNSGDEDSKGGSPAPVEPAPATEALVIAPTSSEAVADPAAADECPICQMSLASTPSEPLPVYTTTCGHAFHQDCLERWFCADAFHTCPSCRAAVSLSDRIVFPVNQEAAPANEQEMLMRGWTGVHVAAYAGNLASLEQVIAAMSPDLNAKTDGGHTALFLAVKNGHMPIVQYLLEQPGIDLSHDATLLLRLAIGQNNAELARILYKKGAMVPFDRLDDLMALMPELSWSARLGLRYRAASRGFAEAVGGFFFGRR